MKIGFIGTGVMGSSMIKHLLNAKYDVHIYNRTKSKTDTLVEKGAIWQDTPRKIAEVTDVIFTIVGYPNDVEEVYFGSKGIFEGLSAGKIIIDMTTSTPALAVKIAEEAKKINVASLDAPVSGGDLGAQKGTLTVMVGGNLDAFEQVQPIIMNFATDLNLFGKAGSGQHTKMANQIMVAGTLTGLTEMLVYSEAAGLDLKKVVQTVNGGAGRNWSLENYGPRIIKEDYSPGFFVKHFVKDLGIVLEEAKNMRLNLPTTKQAYRLYEQLQEKGYKDEGVQSLINLWWKETE